jgi:mono/diheme cytochrome c family protein
MLNQLLSKTLQVALACVFVAMLSASGRAQTLRTVQDGVYTDVQAARGATLYTAQCASCHGPSLQGLQAPPLTGDSFMAVWQQLPLSELSSKIRNTMPAGAQGSLTPEQTADLMAHILKTGGFPSGGSELAAAAAAMSRIGWPQRAMAAVPQASGPAKPYPPLGNMAQLMRGIFFPNSNLIFTVQTNDPAAKPEKVDASTQSRGFSWIDWGAGIYGGWELVDNAAIALADASPLMLVPMRCENGRQAPVSEPEWIKYTERLIEVSRRIYKISQTRNQEAVAEATGDLSDACAACHGTYREIRTRGQVFDPNDPSNKANRCLPRSGTALTPPAAR